MVVTEAQIPQDDHIHLDRSPTYQFPPFLEITL